MANPPLILVVDDEAHIRHVVSLKLRNAGFEVLTAEDGEEGLALALERRPDLVITDFQMPYMTGVEMSVRIAQDESIGATPILMLTARGFSLPEQAMAQTNILAVLAKPFSPRDILARVSELLGGMPSDSQVSEVP